MRIGNFIGATALVALIVGLGPACAVPMNEPEALDDEPEALGEAEQAFVPADCPPDAEPCDCGLKGTNLCKDPDGDGIVTLNDNCSSVYNPYQEDCDADSQGDACDSVDATQTKTKYTTYEGPVYFYDSACYSDHGTYYLTYGKYHNWETVTTIYCAGPLAGQTVTTTNDLGYTYPFLCYKYSNWCPFPNMPYYPLPRCL